MGDHVTLRTEGSRATITLDHGRMNTLTPSILDTLLEMVADVADDSAVRVLVLEGAGDAFCAGADVGDPGNVAGSPAEQLARLDRQSGVVDLLRTMDKTTIAAINGACAGAGLSLALGCDLRVATDTSRFRLAFASVGLSGDFGISWTLPRLVGEARARELFLLDPKLDAHEAMAWGLVSEVVGPQAIGRRVDELAGSLAQLPTATVGAIKANLSAQSGTTLSSHLRAESRRHLACAAEVFG